jgi:hypothetical protein
VAACVHLSQYSVLVARQSALTGSAHEQLGSLSDRVNGCYTGTCRTCSLSETNNCSLGLKIQRVQQETCGHLKGLFQKFKRVNDIIDKKIVKQDEEMDRVLSKAWSILDYTGLATLYLTL